MGIYDEHRGNFKGLRSLTSDAFKDYPLESVLYPNPFGMDDLKRVKGKLFLWEIECIP